MPETLLASALPLPTNHLNGLNGSELLRYASSHASQESSSDRSSITLRVMKADLLPTEMLHSKLQKTTMRNRKARRSRRLKIKRVGVVNRQRGFGAAKGSDNATRHSESHQPSNHRHHKRHHRHHKLPTDPISGLPQATFNQLSAEMLFGAPTDIAAGWDGTLSAIDPSGAHHLYDSIGDGWNPFDEGIDAIAFDWINNVLYCFRGNQFITINTVNNQTSAPTEIASEWPNLPHSFTQRVTGATFAPNGKFYLFNGGRYVPTDGSATPVNLTDWSNWPINDSTFGSGVIDGVIAEYVRGGVLILRGNQGLAIDLVNRTILRDSAPLREWHNFGEVLPQDWLSSGIGTGVWTDVDSVYLFKGPAMLTLKGETSPVTPFYIPTFPLFSNWPITWHPRLAQAPSGRIGDLWSVDASNNVYHHDGTVWSVIEGWAATSISVGQDGTTVYLSPYANVNGNWQTDVYQVVEKASQNLTPFPGDAVQISVGNAEQIWVRDNHNNVHQYNLQQKSWNAVDLGVSPTATAIAADGTLWHNDNQGNAYRFLAGGSTKSVAGITNAQKLTTTGYGSVHCLVQQDSSAQQGSTQLYRYDSPYVFKSSQGYPISSGTSIVRGLGNLYMIIDYTDEQTQRHSYIVAVDAHTGQEISRTEDLGSEDLDAEGNSAYYIGVVFDPIHELVYLTSYLNSTQSVVTAVDARNLKNEIWHFTASIIDTPPALSGTRLCFGDRSGTLYLFNTSVALQTANQSEDSNPNLQPKNCGGWQQTIPGLQTSARLSTPVFAQSPYGQINVMVVSNFGGDGENILGMALVQCDVQTPSNMKLRGVEYADRGFTPSDSPEPFTPIVLGQALFKDNSTQPALLLVSLLSNAVLALPFTLSGEDNLQENLLSFKITQGNYVQTGIGYNPGVSSSDASVWFADTSGTLWGLNSQLKVVNQHHATGDDPNAKIATTPFIYNTPVPSSQNTGQTVTKPVVFFGITSINTDFDWNSLFIYDPVSGNQSSIETGVTEISALSTSLNNGVIYAGGNTAKFTPSSVWFQVFGIRVDELIQGLRDFIIESQLMQDPDGSATNGNKDQNIPPSVARYQTHMTLVDDLKAPRINEAVKIWADQPNTQVIINGQSYTIGPDDNPTPAGQSPLPGQTGYSYASVKTGTDGTLVIVSTAGNVNTSMLRVWTTFMDPYERILVFPDHEFHGRVSNSYASSSSTSDDTYTDPDHPDLSSVGNYSGNSLFTDADKKAGQPKQIANATQQMRQGLNPGASTQVQLGRVLSALRSADPNTPYVPYEDLTGMHYAPNNAIASRPAQINQAMGLKFALADPNGSYDPNNNPFSHTEMDHADARTAIDNLEGELWSPTEVGLPFEGRRVGNIFTDFWNFLVSAVENLAAEIKQVIVSVAEDIAIGLQYVWNGIKKAFKAIIKVIEDIAHAIASFFLALAKLIMDIIEALSVLFHFGEIMWTQKWLAGQVTTQVANLKTLIQSNIIPHIDSFFQNGEAGIKDIFDQLRKKVSTNLSTNQLPPNTSQLPGSGTTSHTAFKAGSGSVGPNSSGSSRSVHCSWSLQKMKHGLPGTEMGSSATQVADEPSRDFINTFMQRLTDGDLSSAFSQLKTDFTNTFSSCSVSTFFDNLLITLLDLIETFVLAALEIAQAFVDGMMAVIDGVIETIKTAITQTIDIPVLSWLYYEITNEDLTILNLITLVAAIPVTIIYRVVEGEYPSQGFKKASANAVQAEINPPLAPFTQLVLGASAGVATVIAGIVNGIADIFGEENPPAPVSYIQTALGMVIAAISGPELTYTKITDPPTTDEWIAYGVGIVGLLLSVFGLPVFNLGPQSSFLLTITLSGVSCFSALGALGVYIDVLNGSSPPDYSDNDSFAAGLVGAFPGFINPAKLLGEEAAGVVAVIDALAGLAVGGIGLYLAFNPPT